MYLNKILTFPSFLTVSFVILVFCQNDPRCLFGSLETGLCHDCSADYYRESGTIDEINPNICIKRSNSTQSLELFVKNSTCQVNELCDGSLTSPVDSIAKALIKAHKESNKYYESDIKIMLLGTTHYVLRNSVPENDHYFFRGIRANLEISPCLCSYKLLTGCFQSASLNANIIIKSPVFTLYTSKRLALTRLSLEATDIHLINSTEPSLANDCANQARICCASKSLEADFKKFPCGILNRQITFQPLNLWKETFGLINLKPLFPKDPKFYQAPTLVINNCLFVNFFPSNDTMNWVSLIIGSADSGVYIEIVNSTFSNLRFLKGILWVADNDIIYYSRKNIEEKNYLINLGTMSMLKVKNCSFGKYDPFNNFGQPSGNENSLFVIENIKGEISFIGGNFSNNTNSREMYRFFVINNCKNVSLIETSFLNIRNISILNIQASNLIVYNSTFKNMSFNNGFVAANSRISINNSLFDTINKNSFLKNLLYISKGEVLISRTVLSNNNKIGLIIYDCSNFTLSESSILSHNSRNETLFELYNTPIILNANTINSFKETYSCNLFIIINWDREPMNHFIDSFYFTGYRMYDWYSGIFYFKYSNPKDKLFAQGIFIEKSDMSFIFYPYGMDQITIYNTTISKMTLNSLGTILIWTESVSNVIIENLIVNGVFTDYSLIYFDFCKSICEFSLKKFSLQKVVIDYTNIFTLFEVSKGLIENGIIDDIYFINNQQQTKTYFVIEIGSSLLSFKELIINYYRFSCSAIFNLDIGIRILENITINQSSLASGACRFCEIFYLDSLTLSNITLYNVLGYYDSPNLEKYGLIYTSILLERYFIKLLDIQVNITNIKFINCSKSDYGLITLINIRSIFLSNITIDNSPNRTLITSKGGAFAIVFAKSVEIYNLKINFVEGDEFSGSFFKNIVNLTMAECEFKNIIAKNSGSIGIFNVSSFNGNMIVFNKLKSQSNGGAFYIEDTTMLLSFIIAEDIEAMNEGGFIFFTKGTINLASSRFIKIKARYGGIISLYEADKLLMKNITHLHGDDSIISGVTAKLINLKTLLIDVLLVNYFDCPNSIGNIFIKNDEPNELTFLNVFINNTSLRTGNFVLLEGDSRVVIKNIEISWSAGTAIKAVPRSNSTFEIENFSAFRNGINNLTTNCLIEISNVNLHISGKSNINNNIFLSSVIASSSSNITLESVNFHQNNMNFYGQSLSILDLVFSQAKLLRINYTVDEKPQTYASLFTVKESEIFINECIIFNCNSLKLACMVMKLGSLQVSDSIFMNSQGTLAGAFYIQGTNLNIFRSKFAFGLSNGSNYEEKKQLNTLIVPTIASEIIILNFNNPTQSVYFSNVTFKARNTNIPVVLFIKIFNIEIKDCEISPLTKQESGLGLVFQESNLKMFNCSFIGLSSLVGSAIRFLNENIDKELKTIELYQTHFISNSANVGGSIILIGKVLVIFEQNTFTENKALNLTTDQKSGIGGCIYYSCLDCTKINFTLINNSFEGNYAEYFASTIFSQAEIFNISNNFSGNFDNLNFTSTLSSLPLSFSI